MSVEDRIVDHIRDHLYELTLAYQKENAIEDFGDALSDVRGIMETAVLTEIDAESGEGDEA